MFNIFISDWNEGIECSSRKFTNYINLAGLVICLSIGRLYKGIWIGCISESNCMIVNKVKWLVLHLNHNNSVQCYRFAGSCLAKKGWRALTNS